MKIKIKVKPNSAEQSVVEEEDYYVVKLKSVAREGKANAELLKVLKKYFGREVSIKSGKSSRVKWVELDQMPRA